MSATGFVYKQTEPHLWTVGFYGPDGSWWAESDHDNPVDAAKRTHYLNGGNGDGEQTERAARARA